jgi:hypothetical protein
MSLSIYTLPKVPGAAFTTEWVEFCHNKQPFIVIDHLAAWYCDHKHGMRPRRCPFKVEHYGRSHLTGGLIGHEVGRYGSLKNAERAARAASIAWESVR